MIVTESSTASSRPAKRAARAQRMQERRQRSRLRELCDEVLASYRVANGRDLFSESDRAEARQLLAGLLPLR